jgi:hypothetical protein
VALLALRARNTKTHKNNGTLIAIKTNVPFNTDPDTNHHNGIPAVINNNVIVSPAKSISLTNSRILEGCFRKCFGVFLRMGLCCGLDVATGLGANFSPKVMGFCVIILNFQKSLVAG